MVVVAEVGSYLYVGDFLRLRGVLTVKFANYEQNWLPMNGPTNVRTDQLADGYNLL